MNKDPMVYFPVIVFFLILIMCLALYINHYIYKKNNTPKKSSERRHIEDVVVGESIRMEWYSRFKDGIGWVKCLNNDPKTRKMFIEINWVSSKKDGSTEKEQLVLSYNDVRLQNFHLLNSVPKKQDAKVENNFNISELQKQMNDALAKEQYELADELQKKIDHLLRKPK